MGLTSYCESIIKAIKTKEDYIKASDLIQTLKTKGGTKEVFDAIKYEVASVVENTDLYSFNSYKSHMESIWAILRTPQSDFRKELKQSKGSQEMLTSKMQGHAFLMQTPAAASADADMVQIKEETLGMG